MSLRTILKVCLVGLFGALLVIDAADVGSTIVALASGHTTEINPVARFFASYLGDLWGLVLLKVISGAVILGVIFYVIKETPRVLIDDEAALSAMALVVALGFVVILNNFGVITGVRL